MADAQTKHLSLPIQKVGADMQEAQKEKNTGPEKGMKRNIRLRRTTEENKIVKLHNELIQAKHRINTLTEERNALLTKCNQLENIARSANYNRAFNAEVEVGTDRIRILLTRLAGQADFFTYDVSRVFPDGKRKTTTRIIRINQGQSLEVVYDIGEDNVSVY